MSLKLILGTLCLVALKAQASPPLQLDDQRGLSFEPEFIPLNRAETRFRLPPNFIPENYALDIIPILDDSLEGEGKTAFTAPGTVKITGVCVENTNVITLHSQDIVFAASDVTVC